MSYIKDLEVGKVYTMLYKGKDKYIVRSNGTSNVFTIWLEKEIRQNACISASHNWELSTPKDTAWLEACVKAGKFIPLKDINVKPKYNVYVT